MKLKEIFETPKNENHFFGYYDKSPLNKAADKLLSLRVGQFNGMPDGVAIAELGYSNLRSENPTFKKISETTLFNWQQGCRLQWLGPDFNQRLIFNAMVNGRYASKIVDLTTSNEQTFDYAVYDVSQDGKFALCVDHERHEFFRPSYSYKGVNNQAKNLFAPDDDGIYNLDLITGKAQKIITLGQVMRLNILSSMEGAIHYLEHLMISPSGKWVSFLHRWKTIDGGIHSRLYVSTTDGKHLKMLLDSGRVGHFNWINDNELIIYAGKPTPLNSLRKRKKIAKFIFKPLLPIYHKFFKNNGLVSKIVTGDQYLLINIVENTIVTIAPNLADDDGHPSVLPNHNDYFITDTYPRVADDGNSYAKLLGHIISENKTFNLGHLKSDPELDNTGWRCDLHPRVSLDGKNLCIDTVRHGNRSILVYEIQL